MTIKFTAALIGQGTLLIQCADRLLARGHHASAIVSSDPTIEAYAQDKGIACVTDVDSLAELASGEGFDYVFSIGNLKMLGPAVLGLARGMAINFHDALLPKYAGLHATSWALINCETTHGITWHEMTERADAGRLLKQREFPIADNETALTLNARCYEAAIDAFEELIEDLADGTVRAIEQPLAERQYFGRNKRPSAACVIAWDQDAHDLDALVRAVDFGPYPNPMGLAKIAVGREFVVVGELEVLTTASAGEHGTVVALDDASMIVRTGSRDVAVGRLRTLDNKALTIAAFAARYGVRAGMHLPSLEPAVVERLNVLSRATSAHEEYWVKRLSTLRPLPLPYRRTGGAAQATGVRFAVDAPVHAATSLVGDADAASKLLAALTAFFARLADVDSFDVALSDSRLLRDTDGIDALFASSVPLHVHVDPSRDFNATLEAMRSHRQSVESHYTFPRDIAGRYPALAASSDKVSPTALPVHIAIVDVADFESTDIDAEMAVVIQSDGARCRWHFDRGLFATESMDAMIQQFSVFLGAALAQPSRLVSELPLLGPAERHRLVVEWNDSTCEYRSDRCVHQLIEEQAHRVPDAAAVACDGRELTYAELNTRANQLAHRLRALGVGPDVLVGVCLDRSIEMVVALLGVLKAGGAYVPLDPGYPRERLAMMLEDASVAAVLTQDHLAALVPPHNAPLIRMDADWPVIAREETDNPPTGVSPEHLAYVIFTSGSTGRPKGVMVTHRNVVNFFRGMDDRVGGDPAGTWLAVTSISFDISVQELFWPLTRGYKVVVYSGGETAIASAERRRPEASHDPTSKTLDFSLFYFASEEGQDQLDKYRLLLEGTRFADRNGFTAVWTPERHFHAFGGLYPNPSVISAALAVMTERIQLRAGSVVLPLHSPIRVAEEWALVDNLSHGRVGISFASGWQPNDFVFKPEQYADRKNLMFRDIQTVQALWKGDAVSFRGGDGRDVAVRTLPRPVQSELPIWITAAGSPDTFRMAGEIGANLLTHLLGQTVEELGKKIAVYREAWRAAGHGPRVGKVTVMLHTFVGTDVDVVREIVRKPMCDYLRSSVDLIKSAPATFPTFAPPTKAMQECLDRGLQNMTEEDRDTLLEFAFDRYFESSALFGSPDDCLRMVERVKAIDVDEIACLIDFGIDTDEVLASLELLNAVRARSNEHAVAKTDYSVPALIRDHCVTHLQCTPSLGRMLIADDDSARALGSLRKLFLGGEALPHSLLTSLSSLMKGEIHNMYGPTETTIWSASCRVDGSDGPVPIGRPLANTELFILDRHRNPVPVGVPGELFIGGAGVARGYLNRPDLTADRFVQSPFIDDPTARLYRTGDQARYLPDGSVEFLGRLDRQMKIRGFRVELEEIEAALEKHQDVRHATAVVREDVPGDQRLIAYLVPVNGSLPTPSELRVFVQATLPDFMVPSTFVRMSTLPLTPNGKVNRSALPRPARVASSPVPALAVPRTELEGLIAGAWAEALRVEAVGLQDNFFDLGAHSLLIVQVQTRLQQLLDRQIPLIQFFRCPTVSALTSYLSETSSDAADSRVADRAAARRGAVARRQRGRALASRH